MSQTPQTPLDLAADAHARTGAMLPALCAIVLRTELVVPLLDLPPGGVKRELRAGEPFQPVTLEGPGGQLAVIAWESLDRAAPLLERPMGVLRMAGRDFIRCLPPEAHLIVNLGTPWHVHLDATILGRLRESESA